MHKINTQTITKKHNNQTKTKLSPQGPQWSRHSVASVCGVAAIVHPQGKTWNGIFLENV